MKRISRRALMGLFAVSPMLMGATCQGPTLTTVTAQINTWISDIGNGLEAADKLANVTLPTSITDLIGKISGLASTISTGISNAVASPVFQQIMAFAGQLGTAVSGFSSLPTVVVNAANFVRGLIPSIASFFGLTPPASGSLRSMAVMVSPEQSAQGLEQIIAQAASR